MTGGFNRRADHAPPAVGAVIAALFALSLNDALIKSFDARYTLWQIFVLRSLIATPALLAMVWWLRRRGAFVGVRSPKWIALRSLLFVTGGMLFFAALPHLPFSVAAAVLNTAPLLVVWFAALLGGERAPKIVWLAVGVGFAGVLLIIRPDASGFNAYALLALACAVLYALTMVVTRIRCGGENAYTLAIGVNLAFIAAGALASLAIVFAGPPVPATAAGQFLLAGWSPLAARDWLLIGGLSVLLIIATFGAAFAYQRARSSIVAPFEYFYLAFGLLWGFWFFAERPDALSLAGMAMIVGAGLTVLRHQARRLNPKRAFSK